MTASPVMPSSPAIAPAVTRVVAGEHPDPDARLAALCDGPPGLRSGRVHDPDQRQQHHPVQHVLGLVAGIEAVGGEVLRTHGQDLLAQLNR